jgi:hypothetical protein
MFAAAQPRRPLRCDAVMCRILTVRQLHRKPALRLSRDLAALKKG